jgi:uncharacterized membrane protein SpoIIM required for sporulation
MKEARFINQNIESWERIEKLGQEYELSASDTATKDYIKSNNDLSFARTFFPHSNISRYLNGLAVKLHTGIHVTEIAPMRELKEFFLYQIPETAYKMRKYIGISLLVFTIGMAIGIFSSVVDPDYVRAILGDGYVNMTIENIKNGHPMDVYADMDGGVMFDMISLNNARVSFMALAAGMFFAVGSGIVILINSVMFGTFMHMFFSYGVLDTALRTVMIHGTIELSEIVVTGGAGMYLGASFMFPGTYSRGKSFVRGARDAVTLVIGMLPFVIIAALLESFVTRQSGMPDTMFYMIILLSFVLFWGYLYALPKYRHKMADKKAEIAGTAGATA